MTQISIIIPAYNAQDTLARTLESVLVQTCPDYEVIIIDDGSQDETKALAQSYCDKDERFQLISYEKNGGVSHARNQGLKVAQGKWLALLDADDWMAPQRLERLNMAAETLGADVVFDNLRVISPKTLKTIFITCFGDEGATSALSVSEYFRRDTPYNKFAIGYASPFVRTSFIREKEITYNTDYSLGEDFAFTATALIEGARTFILPFADYYYLFKQAEKLGQSAYTKLDDKYDQVVAACDLFLEKYIKDLSEEERLAIEQRRDLFSRLGLVRHVRLMGWKSGWLKRCWAFVRVPLNLWFVVRILCNRFINPPSLFGCIRRIH